MPNIFWIIIEYIEKYRVWVGVCTHQTFMFFVGFFFFFLFFHSSSNRCHRCLMNFFLCFAWLSDWMSFLFNGYCFQHFKHLSFIQYEWMNCEMMVNKKKTNTTTNRNTPNEREREKGRNCVASGTRQQMWRNKTKKKFELTPDF